jgi:TPR repeat protein
MAAQAAMTKPFAHCSLPDLALEIFFAERAAACSALDAAAAAQLLPRLADAEATEAALQRHPLVRGASGLVCTGTAESERAWCSMLRDLFSASGAAVSDAALLRVYLVCRQCCGCGRVRVCAFISRILSYPAAAAAGHELLAQLTAHPILCLASQLNFARWRAMLRCHTPSPAHAPHWHVIGIDVGMQQRRAVLCGGALLRVLVPRLLCVQGEYGVIYPLNLARRIASRRHFLGLKLHQAEGVFEEGQQLYGEQRFSEAAERWGRAALLQHAPSHAHLSGMLIDGRAGVAENRKRAFALAAAGAALGCAHSKGALGRCYAAGFGVAKDEARGLALGRESAAAGSCFGQFVVAKCYDAGWGVAQDDAEAVRFYRHAAAQGHVMAQNNLGVKFAEGQVVAQDYAEAVRLYSLAAAQGHVLAQSNLGNMFANGQGVARDDAEAARLYRLAAEQGNAIAQFILGNLFYNGQGVAQDRAEAIRLYRLAAAQGHAGAIARLKRLGA